VELGSHEWIIIGFHCCNELLTFRVGTETGRSVEGTGLSISKEVGWGDTITVEVEVDWGASI
jgi:hypothetical protein